MLVCSGEKVAEEIETVGKTLKNCLCGLIWE